MFHERPQLPVIVHLLPFHATKSRSQDVQTRRVPFLEKYSLIMSNPDHALVSSAIRLTDSSARLVQPQYSQEFLLTVGDRY